LLNEYRVACVNIAVYLVFRWLTSRLRYFVGTGLSVPRSFP
jgi:hypothetical protein